MKHYDECNEGPFLGWEGVCQDGWHGYIYCDQDHTIIMCQPWAGEIGDQVAAALDEGRVGDVLAIVSTEPRVELNLQRRAVQIRGCDGENVVAHLPVPMEIFAALIVSDAAVVVAQH
jgi:hypothetical protein